MTPDDILRIARAVWPKGGTDIEQDEGAQRVIVDVGQGWIEFDPLNSNDDAFRVLAWLLKTGGFVDKSRVWHGSVSMEPIPYDGTEASLRHAITEAAKRVTEAA